MGVGRTAHRLDSVFADSRPLSLGQLAADPRAARSANRPACPPGVHHRGDSVGQNERGRTGLCHIIANLPGPTLWLDQTDDDAKDQAESRLHKLFEDCAPVKALFPTDRHKKRNTTIHFRNGMTLWVLGAHNKTNLQRRSIRWLIGDETWRWPVGHMAEAEARVTAFGWLGKCVFMSQGGEENDDTHRKFETTDMREWMFQCPKCGARQPWSWEQIEWSKSARDESWRVGLRRGPAHGGDALRVVQSLLRRQRPHAPGAERDGALRRAKPARSEGERRVPLERALHDELGRARGAVSAREGHRTARRHHRAQAVLPKAACGAVARVCRGLQARDHAQRLPQGRALGRRGRCERTRPARRRAVRAGRHFRAAPRPHRGLPDRPSVRRRALVERDRLLAARLERTTAHFRGRGGVAGALRHPPEPSVPRRRPRDL